ADERQLAFKAIQKLQADPLCQGRVGMDVVAWDKPGGRTPLLASMTPQEAISQGLPRPSECEVVVVILWSRMGTPLPREQYRKPDGNAYLSGTQWEYEDALSAAQAAGKPYIIVYRRTERVFFDPDTADFQEKVEQRRRVNAFF